MKIRTQIILTCFLILTWQGLVITRTLQTRLQDRTDQLEKIIESL